MLNGRTHDPSQRFSKTFAWTGGRIGYAVLPTVGTARDVQTLNINYFSCVAPYNQEAAVVALLIQQWSKRCWVSGANL